MTVRENTYFVGLKNSSPHTLSFTDAEYEKLAQLAEAANLNCSECIIDRLGLGK